MTTLATIKELATSLKLSEPSIRRILAKKEAPIPVVPAKAIKGGKLPGQYDLEEFTQFYHKALYNMHVRDRWFVQ